ncbi:MAG: GNAT family N-acetyltransferase [Myxococcota bacterium]
MSDFIMLSLVRPSIAHATSYLDSIEEMRALGETIWEGWCPRSSESIAEFIERVRGAAVVPESPLVPMSTFWALHDDENIVGRIALRHHLTPSLKDYGGHVGYEVRPSYRRRGIGREMLRQLLRLPKAHAIGTLLVTCAPDNLASIKVIEANGGRLLRCAVSKTHGRNTLYYAIDPIKPGAASH